jgi:hypothetical protein
MVDTNDEWILVGNIRKKIAKTAGKELLTLQFRQQRPYSKAT